MSNVFTTGGSGFVGTGVAGQAASLQAVMQSGLTYQQIQDLINQMSSTSYPTLGGTLSAPVSLPPEKWFIEIIKKNGEKVNFVTSHQDNLQVSLGYVWIKDDSNTEHWFKDDEIAEIHRMKAP